MANIAISFDIFLTITYHLIYYNFKETALATTATKEQVREFLQEVKDVMTKPVGKTWSWVLVHRKKNLDFISGLGFSYFNIYNTILSLSVKDYCEGPENDVTEHGEVWIFGTRVEGKETYIKLKIASFSILKIVRIISFHETEQPLCYPYKE
jgi:hypothetical protein